MAIVNGVSAGTEELQTKSFPTFAYTPATMGSSEFIRMPYTDEASEGESGKFIT